MNSRLASHIECTLLRHQCAVVPELGGFVLEVLPANYDAASGLAYPPTSTLRFQPALSHQDGLLVTDYAETYGISHRRARIMLEDDVRELRKSLVEHRTHHLPHIGSLTLDPSGNLLFSAETNTLLHRESYGLSPVALAHLEEQEAKATSAEKPTTKYLTINISKRALSAAAILLVCLLASLPWLSQTNSQPSEPSFKAGFVPSPDINVGQIISTILPEKQPTSAPSQGWIIPEQGKYYVIIASERSRERAEGHYATACTEESIATASILEGKKIHRVSAGVFASSVEAYQYIDKLIHTSTKYRSAWVYQAP